MDRVAQLAVVAARRAVADAPCEWSNDAARARGGVFVGTGMGGSLSMDDGYQTLYGDYGHWVRPLTMFTEVVEVDGQAVPRFALITAEESSYPSP